MLLLDVVVSTSLGVLLLPRVAPRGFNTFDSYNPTLLNTTSVKTLANYLATTLLPSGYDTLCLDGGWSITHKSYTNGTTYEYQNMDGNGHSIAAPERFADIKALSNAICICPCGVILEIVDVRREEHEYSPHHGDYHC